VVGVGGGVGQPGVKHDHLGAVGAGLSDPLGVRVEVVPGFQVGADQVDDLGVGVIGAGPVDTHPELEPSPAAGRAHVGVGVVPVHAPARQHPLGEPVLPRAADVDHDLVLPALDDRGPDPGRQRIENLVPADSLPPAATTWPGPAQRVQDAVWVGDLVDRGWALGTVTPAGAGVLGVPLELAHLARLAVDVSQQPTGGLAVEAGGRHERVVPLLAGRPGPRGQFHPVIPAFFRRERGQVDPARPLVERLSPGLDCRTGRRHPGAQSIQVGVTVLAGHPTIS
jgi:hypothetical protein